jgi:hypothetical protein
MISKEEIAAKIPDLAERENAAVLLRALVDAEIAVGEAPDDQLEAARAKRDAADDAYSALGFPAFYTDENQDAIRCALSGVPMHEDDEYLKDPKADEMVLRCFTGLPPREMEEMEDAA